MNDSDLSRLVAPGKSWRNRPHLQDGKTYVTNGAAMLVLDRAVAGAEEANDFVRERLSFPLSWRAGETRLTTAETLLAWCSGPVCALCQGSDRVLCVTCGGTGERVCPECDRHGWTCTDCGGTGSEPCPACCKSAPALFLGSALDRNLLRRYLAFVSGICLFSCHPEEDDQRPSGAIVTGDGWSIYVSGLNLNEDDPAELPAFTGWTDTQGA